MGEFKYFKYFEKDAVADGATYEDTWRADENLKIKRVHLARKDGSSFTKSTFYWKVSERVHTHSVVPCHVLGPDKLTSPELDFKLDDGETLAFTLKNLEGVDVDVMITLEAWSP